MTTPSTTTAPSTPDLDSLEASELPTAASAYVPVLAAQLMAQRGCPWAVSGDATTLVNRIRTIRLDLGLEVAQ